MFALESLSLNNESYNNSLSVRKACRFFLDRQMADGGWGESFEVRDLPNLTQEAKKKLN
jgi:lanosterol synthase